MATHQILQSENNKNLQVRRIDKETGAEEIIDIDTAISKLEGYWIKEKIIPTLLNGNTLFTPYAEYVLINQ